MTTKTEAKQAVTRLREGVAPEFQQDVSTIADALDALVENAAAELGRQGGAMRAKKLSKKRRSEIARNAVKAREEKRKGNKKTQAIEARAASDLTARKAEREDIDYTDTESAPTTHVAMLDATGPALSSGKGKISMENWRKKRQPIAKPKDRPKG